MLAIFDLDGTLTDSSNVLANAINYVRAKLGLKPLPKEDIIYQINNPNCNYLEYFYNTNTPNPIYEQWFKEYYSKHHNKDLVLFDGIKEMLQELKSKNIKIAVATNGYNSSSKEALKHLQIDRYIDKLIGFDDVKEAKPAPDMLFKAIAELYESPQTTIFIGDSDNDELAAKAANIKFIRVDFINKKDNPLQIAKKIEKELGIIN